MTNTQTLTKRQAAAIRDWCEDCFDDMPEDATDAECFNCVRNQYEGGFAQFRKDYEI